MFELPKEVIEKISSLGNKSDYVQLSKNYREKKFATLDVPQAIAYAQGRMPATYSVIRYVLDKFFEKIEVNEQGIQFLDIGAGVGTLKIALDARDILVEYEALEKSKAMVQVFRKLHGNNIKIHVQEFQGFSSDKKYSVVFASYFVNEIKEKKQIKHVLQKMFDLSDRYVIIVEPGTPDGYSNIVAAKEIANEIGWYPLLPCARKECDLKKGDWCHFSVRLPRTKLHTLLKNATLPYEDEKFCYVVFSKEETEFENNNIIIKNPIKRSGHIIFDVCCKDGIRRIISTDKANKKLKWGDQLKTEK